MTLSRSLVSLQLKLRRVVLLLESCPYFTIYLTALADCRRCVTSSLNCYLWSQKVPEYCYSTPVYDADSPVKASSSSASKYTASDRNAPGAPLRIKVRVAGWQKDFGLGPGANCEASHGLTDTLSIGDLKVRVPACLSLHLKTRAYFFVRCPTIYLFLLTQIVLMTLAVRNGVSPFDCGRFCCPPFRHLLGHVSQGH